MDHVISVSCNKGKFYEVIMHESFVSNAPQPEGMGGDSDPSLSEPRPVGTS